MSPLEIAPPDALRYLKSLVFAPPGQGKTYFLGTAQDDPRTSPMLLLDFEGGIGTLAGLDVDVATIRSWEDYDEAYELLSSGDHNYKSVGVDSATETHTFALLDILAKEGPTRKDPELLEQRDYGKASVQMRRFLRHFRDLPMHVFFTALAKEVEEPRVGRVKVPMMAGQMADEIAGLVDIVGYLAQTEDEEGETMRLLLLQNYPKFRTKVRSRWGEICPDEIEEPSVTTLLDTLGYKNTTRKRSTKKESE
jgi:hypothetical protein